jgi:predicted transcriptional regulator
VLLEDSIKRTTEVHNELMDTKKSVSELAENVILFNNVVKEQQEGIIKFTAEINGAAQEFIKNSTEIQKECIQISHEAIAATVNLTDDVTNIKEILENLNNKTESTERMVSCLNKITEIEMLTGAPQTEIPTLLNEVKQLNTAANVNTTLIRAILSYLGIDIELANLGTMLENIREAARTRDENVEPVDNDLVNDIEQRQRNNES